MPIYTYKCSECEHEQDEYLSIIKQPKTMKCENCGSDSHKILTGTTNIIFKGDGWADKKSMKR